MWLCARTYIQKADEDGVTEMDQNAQNVPESSIQTQFENEFIIVYHNSYTFQKGLRDGTLH